MPEIDSEPKADGAPPEGRGFIRHIGLRSPAALPYVSGAASAFLYVSVILSFAFLIPVQSAFSRGGRRAGLIAGGIAAAAIAVVLWVMLGAGRGVDPLLAAIGVAPPLAFIIAQATMNAPQWGKRSGLIRALATTGIFALLAVPAILVLGSDPAFTAYFAKSLEAMFIEPLKSQTSTGGQGYDYAAMIATLDPRTMATVFLQAIASSYAALLYAMLGGSWWLGSRFALPAGERKASRQLRDFRVPYVLLWPFLASWAVVLAVFVLDAPFAAKAATLNCALILALTYAAQGLAVIAHYFDRWNIPRVIRIALGALAIGALTTPTVNLAIAVALPVLGVSEVWLPYRTNKGVGA